jgi:hypothetical protein
MQSITKGICHRYLVLWATVDGFWGLGMPSSSQQGHSKACFFASEAAELGPLSVGLGAGMAFPVLGKEIWRQGCF